MTMMATTSSKYNRIIEAMVVFGEPFANHVTKAQFPYWGIFICSTNESRSILMCCLPLRWLCEPIMEKIIEHIEKVAHVSM